MSSNKKCDSQTRVCFSFPLWEWEILHLNGKSINYVFDMKQKSILNNPYFIHDLNNQYKYIFF